MKNSSSENKNPRRKVLYWVAGALSVLMFWKYVRKGQKEEENEEKGQTEKDAEGQGELHPLAALCDQHEADDRTGEGREKKERKERLPSENRA